MTASAYAELGPLVQRFVDAYVRDVSVRESGRPSATGAYRAVHPGCKRPDVIASRLMAQPEVKRAIEERMTRIRALSELDERWVLERLRAIVERCMVAEPVMVKGIPTGEWIFDASGANKALELLGRHFAMFTDKLAGADGGPVQIQVVRFADDNDTGARMASARAPVARLVVS